MKNPLSVAMIGLTLAASGGGAVWFAAGGVPAAQAQAPAARARAPQQPARRPPPAANQTAPPPPAVAKRPSGPDDPYVYFDADNGSLQMTSLLTPSGRVTTLTGSPAKILYKDTVLQTNAATYNHDAQIASAPGRVRIDDPQNTVTGDRGVAYYKRRTAELTGNVRIVARPRPENTGAAPGSLRREFTSPVTIACAQGAYNWRRRVATSPGRMVVNFTWRRAVWTVTAGQGVYDGREEKVTMRGPVRAVSSLGEETSGVDAVIVLREGAESIKINKITGAKIKVEEEEDEGTEESAGARPPAAGTGGPR